MSPRFQENPKWEAQRRMGKIAGGLFVFSIGALFLARELGAELPDWLFTWKSFLIGLGLVLGFKHGFQRGVWLLPIMIGGAYLVLDFFPDLFDKRLFWPVLLMIFGLYLVFKPRNRKARTGPDGSPIPESESCGAFGGPLKKDAEPIREPELEINAIWGGVEKQVKALNFRKGEINAIMAGAQVSFLEADFDRVARLEVNSILGGVSLLLPSHWEIKSELNCIFGGIEDKRSIVSEPSKGETRILVLEGNVFMGGIEIRNF